MPTYTYACTACEHAFDIRQSFTDDALTDCPECERTSLRKVIHPVGIAFKGSGFYKTDSRSTSSSSSSPSSSSSSGTSSTSSSSSGSSGSSGSSSSTGTSSSSSSSSSSTTSSSTAS